jgi:hypothetical protein
LRTQFQPDAAVHAAVHRAQQHPVTPGSSMV